MSKSKEQLIIEKLEELLIKSNEISTFYGKIIDANAMFLHIHHIDASAEEIITGKRLRNEFELLKSQYKELLSSLESLPEEEKPSDDDILKWMHNQDLSQWYGSPSYAWVVAFYKAMRDHKIPITKK